MREEPLKPVTLGVMEDLGEVVRVEICSSCEVICHNINRVFIDRRREVEEEINQLRRKIAEETKNVKDDPSRDPR
jgi:hypothetical protein